MLIPDADISFIRIDPQTREVQFGLYPEPLRGVSRLVQEVYLQLVDTFDILLRNMQFAEEVINQAVKNIESTIKANQAQDPDLPLQLQLKSLIVRKVERQETNLSATIEVIAMSGASTVITVGG